MESECITLLRRLADAAQVMLENHDDNADAMIEHSGSLAIVLVDVDDFLKPKACPACGWDNEHSPQCNTRAFRHVAAFVPTCGHQDFDDRGNCWTCLDRRSRVNQLGRHVDEKNETARVVRLVGSRRKQGLKGL